MALDLNGYIKQSYMRPNRKILEDLGASQELIEYLMETPGNMNLKVVEAIEGAGGGDEWTSFKLHAVEINPEQPGYYVLQGKAEDFEALFNLANRDDLIIAMSYSGTLWGINVDNSDDVCFLTEDGQDVGIEGYAFSTPMGMFTSGHVLDAEYGIDYYGCIPTINAEPADWVEVRYKVGTHYIITFTADRTVSWNMASGQKWITPKEFSSYQLTDGTNTWTFGDTIIPTSDINLTLVRPT